MNTERYVRVFAGLFVLASLALGVEASPIFVSRWFLAFTAFVGLNLFQSGLTRFCPLEIILRKAGVPSAGCPLTPGAREELPSPRPAEAVAVTTGSDRRA